MQDGDKVVIVDDLMSTGQTLCERIDRIKEMADVEISGVVLIADLTNEEAQAKGLGPALLAEKYGTKVYSVITDKDVEKALS